MRRFNVTGLCIPEEDYMVNISGKIEQIRELVEDRKYFTINRARQYGKTTMLAALKRSLNDEYLVASISFEGLGDESFSRPEVFCADFMKLVRTAMQYSCATDEYAESWIDENVNTFSMLSSHITSLCKDRKVVLLIDEVDKASNNRVFLHFLSMLRSKFLARKSGEDYTFHSVVLAGVYDIKNIKLKMIQEGAYTPADTNESTFNSPWNIAVSFKVDMSFNPEDISTMLAEYENDHNTGMDIMEISEEIYSYTNGYPFWVSRMCQCIEDELNRNWTPAGILDAVKILTLEKNTLVDDLSKNLENNKDLYELVYDVLVTGEDRQFSNSNPTVSLGAMYGIIKESNRKVCISNRIYEIIICEYYISKDEGKGRRSLGVMQYDVVREGRFDMELCLRKFAEHYSEIYSVRDMEFLERHGRLLFLSYLKPLVNGKGFYHIESQFTDLRRMDIVVDYGAQQFIIELKIWRGVKYQSEAYEQLSAYLKSKRASEGYMLTFDFRKNADKSRKSEWVELNGKRIFDVIV